MNRYAAEMISLNGYEVVELRDASSGAVATVVPAIGCNAISYIWDGIPVIASPADFQSFALGTDEHTMYGVPLLFPPNRVSKGRFHYGDRDYRLPLNEPPSYHLHGEIARRPWEVLEYGATTERGAYVSCRFEYRSHPDIMAYFPHELTFTVVHALHEGKLISTFAIENNGKDSAPFAFGLHPYFAVPKDASHGGRLKIPCAAEWPVTNLSFVTGLPSRTAFAGRLNEGIALDEIPELGCRLISLAEGDAVCRLDFAESGYRIFYELDRGFPFAVLFKPDWADSFSIEPYTYVTDGFNLPYPDDITGARSIAAGERLTYATTIRVERR